MDPHELARTLRRMKRHEIREYAERFPPISGSSMRDVRFVDERLVLKLSDRPASHGFRSHSRYRTGQNAAEAALWRQLPAEHRPFFATIHDAGGGGFWLIQERVLALFDHQDVDPRLAAVLRTVGVRDVKRANCGVRRLADGSEQPVVFDYAINRLWESKYGRYESGPNPV